MYESFFKLQRRPFSATPDPGCVYQAGSIQTVIDELVVCLERGEGIAVLTAPAGLGKTLLCEKVKQELDSGFVTILLRHANFSNQADLLRTLLAELGQSSTAASEQDARLQFIAVLSDLRQRGQLLVVICDEAHHLTEPLLEELRQMVDHADHGVAWVRLLLTGQLELEEKLTGPELSALNQRLRSHVTLAPFTAAEAMDYIDYRLTWAGGRTEEIFHPDTLAEIITAADGIPRCINQLCDHVMLLAYVAEQQPAQPGLVREALADLQHLPLNWNIRSVRESQNREQAVDLSGSQSDESQVVFGSHLNTWESSPTFSAADAAIGLPDDGVWEFGAETAVDPSQNQETAPPPSDAFENFLKTVESEIERLETEVSASDNSNQAVEEEPVIDRYAAIDAGWPAPDLSHTKDVLKTTAEPPWDGPSISRGPRNPASVPVEYPPTSSRQDSLPTISMPDDLHGNEPELQLQSDVLELVTATRDSINSRRIDGAQTSRHVPLIDESAMNAVETPSPRVSPERPFRNLFTRLRRKQKGLE